MVADASLVMYAETPAALGRCPNHVGVPYTRKLAVSVSLPVRLELILATEPAGSATANHVEGTLIE